MPRVQRGKVAAISTRWTRRVAAPCVCFVPWAALASCRPLPQQLLPVSAAGGGRRRRTFFALLRFEGPSAAAAAAPRRGAGAPSPSPSVTPCPLFVAARHLPPTGGSLSKGEARSTPAMPLAPFQKRGKKRALHGLGSPFGRAGAKCLRGFPADAEAPAGERAPADTVRRYGPSREKVNPKQPQLFRIYKYKNNISADIVRAKRRQF